MFIFLLILYTTYCYAMNLDPTIGQPQLMPQRTEYHPSSHIPLLQQLFAREYGTPFKQKPITFFPGTEQQTISIKPVKLTNTNTRSILFSKPSSFTLSQDANYIFAGLNSTNSLNPNFAIIDSKNFNIISTHKLDSPIKHILPVAPHKNIIFCYNGSIWIHDQAGTQTPSVMFICNLPIVKNCTLLNQTTIALIYEEEHPFIGLLNHHEKKYTHIKVPVGTKIEKIISPSENKVITITNTNLLLLEINDDQAITTAIEITDKFHDITFKNNFFVYINLDQQKIVITKAGTSSTINIVDHLPEGESPCDFDKYPYVNFLNDHLVVCQFVTYNQKTCTKSDALMLIDIYSKNARTMILRGNLTHITLFDPRTIIAIENYTRFITLSI